MDGRCPVATVTFDGVSKVYGNGFRAVDKLDLQISDGEFMVFVGPSGCGKTTALRMLAGLEEISEGELVIDDTVVNDVAPQKRDIAMVFQNYALYPHMTVFDNMAYGLKIQKLPKNEIRRRVTEIANVIGLEDLLNRKPRMLSGGQRQRVAMGRAIVRQPKVFLMDEPLSNLDAKLRVQMRSEVARIQHELSATTVYVTHDQIEAMTMGDRVALLRHGLLQQVDTPLQLYNAPANLFVASFIGSPSMNLIEARLTHHDGALVCEVAGRRLALPPETVAGAPDLEEHVGKVIGIGIRPEHVEDAAVASGAPLDRRLPGVVRAVEALGSELLAHMEVAANPVLTDEVKEVAADLDATVIKELEAELRERRAPVVGRFDVASRARPGDQVEMVIDTRKMHFFDLKSGRAITGPTGAPLTPPPAVRSA
jgi:multiple sugar transport system ATP-binding protein